MAFSLYREMGRRGKGFLGLVGLKQARRRRVAKNGKKNGMRNNMEIRKCVKLSRAPCSAREQSKKGGGVLAESGRLE